MLYSGKERHYSAESLQQKLRESGFPGVYVYENRTPLDPADLLRAGFNMTCGDGLECGEPEAICAQVGGELVVNGDLFKSVPRYSVQCESRKISPDVYIMPCAGDAIYAGDFDGYEVQMSEIEYQIPTNAGYWPLMFFVGSPAQRDPVTGALTEIQFYTLPIERRLEFRRTILKFKPMHSWGGLITVYS